MVFYTLNTDKLVDVSVPISKAELDTFILKTEYDLGVFLEFTGEDAANEDVRQDFKFKVKQDLLIDN